MAGIVLTVLAIGVVIVLLQRGPIDLPWLQTYVEEEFDQQLADHAVTIESVALTSTADRVGNGVLLRNVQVLDDQGVQVMAIPELATQFSLLDLVGGRVAPEDVSITGTELALQRGLDGSFSVFGMGGGVQTGTNVLQLLDSVDEQKGLSALKKVKLNNTNIVFRDQVTEQGWVLDNSSMTIQRDGETVSGRAVLSLGGMDSKEIETASMILNADYLLGSGTASVSFQFSDASPSEIADLFQAFDWLRNLDTRLSGSVRADLNGAGQLGNLHGVLELAEGKLTETPSSQPITFSRAKVYFDYDPITDALNLTEVDLQTSSGSLVASGFVELQRTDGGAVSSMAGQLRLNNIVIQRDDLFDTEVKLRAAALDARLSFSPLSIDVGRLTVFDDETVIKVSGRSVAEENFWKNSYDLDIDKMSTDRLKQLWPKPVVHKTRKWVHENVYAGQFENFSGGFRSEQGKPEFAFNFGLKDADFQYVKTLPILNGGNGFGYLTQQDLRLDLSAGYVVAPNGTPVDIAGSGLFIPDIFAHPTPGEITLHAKGSVQGALGILNVEKFRFLDKVGLKTDLGEGAVSVKGWFKLPLSKDAKTEDVKMALTAELLNFRSTKLIKDRVLTARKMIADVTDEGVKLSGNAELDNVPVNATWTQAFDKGARQSQIAAVLDVTDTNLRQFGIVLPKGTISGATKANMDIALTRGEAPEFVLSSNLVGATLRIPALSWAKSKNTKGRLDLSGTLGDRVTVSKISLDAPGLKAVGTLDLSAQNKLQRARFSSVTVGKWLSTSVVLTPKSGGRTDIVVNGGTADLRFLGGEDSTSSSSGNTDIKLSLDRVRVTNELSLTNFEGKMSTNKGLRGTFVGRVNGSTRIDGQLFPQKFGTAIELSSKDAGGVLASAGLFHNAREGALRVVLVPREGKGNYDGTLDVKRTRLKDASAMAALLNGISLVGVIQQLEGEGIHFNTVEGQFKLRDNGVKLENISAVGPSMGMTLGGWYSTNSKAVDFEGVITPLYAVNGIFERIFGQLVGRRKGEGMFSFTYRMRGAATDPKVSVNPLSILTPGAFREIFRQKPPAPPTQ